MCCEKGGKNSWVFSSYNKKGKKLLPVPVLLVLAGVGGRAGRIAGRVGSSGGVEGSLKTPMIQEGAQNPPPPSHQNPLQTPPALPDPAKYSWSPPLSPVNPTSPPDPPKSPTDPACLPNPPHRPY